ncbi:hypothetical protein [uncultured Flavobacterium sp.]|uniref:hypothetical protein n=1 Tax=uncultured Flavobacterium sp. TaxID=165435 RepID=UPI0030CA505D
MKGNLVVPKNAIGIILLQIKKQAFDQLESVKEMKIVSGATHLFEEPGKLIAVANLTGLWYKKYLILD